VRTLSVETTAHGRVLIEDAADSFSGRLLVGFHGYGQGAETMLEELRRIPGADGWRKVAVQALHRFYTRGDQAVVASWMTREDRDEAIADNIRYVDRAVGETGGEDSSTIVFLGFSQGASMAARAAAFGRRQATGLILLAGDLPPDVKADPKVRLPPTLIGVGSAETWYTPTKTEADAAWLRERGIAHEIVRFAGGHEFTDEFRDAVGRWLARASP
jgi:predicted esterase